MNAKGLQKLYAAAGFPVEIEAGNVGLVVYGPSPNTVRTVAENLIRSIRDRDPKVRRDEPSACQDEPPTTAYVCTVQFDWKKF